ncbi:T9SS type A sorting domain-containing protein [Aureibaculum sp. 2210JD6-5]|uniref:leucine-rich repeat domain-containing protein n=1 Tax=Aureibaculum sp. 2210JD6-5 TaxID=3103957 RepID=UPI002AACFE8F|nr:leucine-rich repeat domain-containing protein [Aureibaculum sp. 2210JD6-5]MDY7395684.1 T9SS type A sorting domain-containing protein [Aureibaculum sp. 2210JD6-5]
MTLTKILKLFTIVFLLATLSSFAQTTNIPDGNFEQALIDLGYDTGAIDGSVPTDNIKNITALNVSNRNISDLTGIEDFAALKNLNCSSNKLTNLDLTKNTALTSLYCQQNNISSLDISKNVLLTTLLCYRNKLTSLDVSKNTMLIVLFCANNKLTSLDVSNNIALRNLYCYYNQLTSLDLSRNTALIRLDCFRNELVDLDVSQNTNLEHLYCYNNQITNLDLSGNTALRTLNCSNNILSSLNLNNGNNTNIDRFFARNNPDLNCITVDDPAYSTANWTNVDAQVIFSINCNPLSTNEFELDGLSIYPNPFQSELNVSILDNANYTLINANGQTVKSGNLMIGDNKFNLASLANGMYYLIIKTETGMASKKVIKY